MGGDVRAYSLPNTGSCFVAIVQADCLPESLPSLRSPNFSQIPFSSDSHIKIDSPHPKRILLVDDDPFNLEFHAHIIRSLGYESIETATDGQKIFEQFKRRSEGYFEAIITDISMPVLDGIGAPKMLRAFEEEEKRESRVKNGFITGHSNQKDNLVCEKSPLYWGFYLSKPINSAIFKSFLPPLNTNFPSSSPKNQNPMKHVEKAAGLNISRHQPIKLVANSQSPLILCVEDDIFNPDLLEEIINNLGARVIKAQSGEESLSLLKAAIADNIIENILKFALMDCRIPKILRIFVLSSTHTKKNSCMKYITNKL